MRDYVIVTDSGCDIKPALLKEWGVESCNLTFRFVNDDKEYSNSDMSVGEFYDRMRLGGVAKTAAVNSQSFATKFEQIVKQGNDVIYIGFSSGLSTTYNSARIAAQQTLALYPDAKIYTVDTLAASAGQGLIVKLTVDKKNDGASVEEAYEFA